MTKVPFKTRIRDNTPAIGTMVTLNSPEVAEILSLCGFDWLFIDMEHGALDIPAAQGVIRAIGGNCSSIVRIPENSPLWIKRVLDLGCDGIVVPLVCSAAEARAAVDAARYPPAGRRSAGIARAHGYGLHMAEYITAANERLALIIQIEHITAIQQLDEILQVRGIDGILIGPYDLSASMNRLGAVQHPAVQEAIATIRGRCAERDMPVGIFVLNPENIAVELERGTDFLIAGTDVSFMTATAKQVLDISRSSTASTD